MLDGGHQVTGEGVAGLSVFDVARICALARVQPRTSCVRRAIPRRGTRVAASLIQTPGNVPATRSLAIVRAATRRLVDHA
jgi:hypothetical protein